MALIHNLNRFCPTNMQDMMDQAIQYELKGRLPVVDDDLDARQTLDALLSHERYETRCATDGKTALVFAEADPPELILLDVRLPDLDRYEVCTLMGPEGKTKKFKVDKSVKRLNKIKKGDDITLWVTQALAIDVVKP